MKLFAKIPKKKGLVYRGISNQEFISRKKNGYFKSATQTGTYFSEDPYTAECYAERLADLNLTSVQGKPTYVVAVEKKAFKTISAKDLKSVIKNRKEKGLSVGLDSITKYTEKVSGDDELIKSKIPFNKVKEIYEFQILSEKWKRIK